MALRVLVKAIAAIGIIKLRANPNGCEVNCPFLSIRPSEQ